MIFHNMSAGSHLGLSGKSILEIFFGRVLVLVRLVGIMAFESRLQALF